MVGSEVPLGIGALVCLLLSSYFAALEVAYSSASKIKIQAKAESSLKKSKSFSIATDLIDNCSSTVSAIILWLNIVHTSFATLITLLVVKIFGLSYAPIGTFCGALIIFVIGEVIPKIIVQKNPEAHAVFWSPVAKIFFNFIKHISFFFEFCGTKICSVFLRDKKDEPEVNDEDLKDMIEEAYVGGAIEEDTRELIQHALTFDKKKLINIMVDWRDVEKLCINDTSDFILRQVMKSHYSRLVAVDRDNRVVGVIKGPLLLQSYYKNNKKIILDSALFKPFFIKADTLIDDALKIFQKNKVHLAYVVDTRSKIIGIVTLEDILEELVGEIWDEGDVENGR